DRRRSLGQRPGGDHLGGELHTDLEKHLASWPRGTGPLVRLVRRLPGDAGGGADRPGYADACTERVSGLLPVAVGGGRGIDLRRGARAFASPASVTLNKNAGMSRRFAEAVGLT